MSPLANSHDAMVSDRVAIPVKYRGALLDLYNCTVAGSIK